MNFFDQLAAKGRTNFVIPGTVASPFGNSAPALDAPTTQPNPFDQFDTPAPPQAQPPQVAQPDLSQHEQAAQNPFDQFDTPAPAPQQAQPQHALPQQMDGTPMRYRNAANGEGVEVPTDGMKSIPTPERGHAAQQLSALVGDRRNSDAAIIQFAQHHGIFSPTLLLQLQFRKDHPDYNGAYRSEGFDHMEVPMTTGEKVYNEIGTSAPGVYVVNTGLAAGDLGNGITGGALEHAFGDADLNRAKVAAINAQHPTAATLGTITGSIAGGVAADKAVADVAGLASKPLIRAGVRVLGDAASGAAQGAGAAEDGSRMDGALLGAVINPVAGVVGRTVARPLGAAATGNPTGQEVLDAARRLSASGAPEDAIQPLAGHVSNGGMMATLHALAEPSLVAGKIPGLHAATVNFEQNAGKALGRIADREAGGTAQELTTVAAQANDAANPGSLAAYAADSKQASDAIYGRASQLAGNTRLATPRTITALDVLIDRARETPGGIPGFEKLVQLREDLASSNWTVDGLRRLRTSFGDSLDSTQRSAREAANSLWPTLSQDISGGLRAAGKSDAAKAYRAADVAYAQRSANMDVITRVIGKEGDQSADQVANRIASMSKVEYNKLSQAMSAIHPDQAAQLRGGLIDSLGHPTAANADQGFSLTSFGTRWAKLSDQAKAALYPPQTIRDLNDLATLSIAQKGIQRLGNTSGSATHLRNAGEVSAMTTALLVHPASLLAALPPAIGGKLLATPGVAKAMVALAQNKPLQVVTRRLSEVARRNPAAGPAIQMLVRNLSGNNDGNASTLPPPDPAIATTPAPMQQDVVDPTTVDPTMQQIDPYNPYAVSQ